MTMRRDIEVSPSMAPSGARGRKVIAAIGIDRYHHWQRLANAVRDAMRTAELFGQLGFEQVTAPLLDHDATGKAIQSLVTSDLKKLGPSDSLVVFFAGHGATYGHRPGGEEIKTGYLIPADASSSSDDISTWIDLEGWLRAVALLPAKHILVILDACRSGIALDGIIQRHRGDESWQHETSTALQARRSRRIITSALGNQVALDAGPKHGHSLFTGCLIEGLTYDLRRRGDQATTGSELGTYLQRRVDAYTKSRQTPDFGWFFHDDRGEIAIPLVGGGQSPTPPANPIVATAATLELAPREATKPVHDRAPETSQEHAEVSLFDSLEREVNADVRPTVAEEVAGDNPVFLLPEPPQDRPGPALPPPTRPPTHVADLAPPGDPAQPASAGAGQPPSAPLDRVELGRWVARLEDAATMTRQGRTAVVLMCFLAMWFGLMAATFGLERPSSASLFFVCALLITLGIVAWRVTAPARKLRVVRAVREAPEYVVLLRHFVLSARIEIKTSRYRLVVKAADDGQMMFEALMRRCPTAKVERR